MTYQNIMIDRIKILMSHSDCPICPLNYMCEQPGNDRSYCSEIKEWLNEQYI